MASVKVGNTNSLRKNCSSCCHPGRSFSLFFISSLLSNDININTEGVGFEPTVSFPTHALQACAFNHSAILPFPLPFDLVLRRLAAKMLRKPSGHGAEGEQG